MDTRIGVITDAHANLPATRAALARLDEIGCDLIVHLGDAIGIGPYPREVLEVLLERDDLVLLMGNHDELFAFNQLQNPPQWMSAGELAHQRWTHAQLREEWREEVRTWPRTFNMTVGATTVRFQHYAIRDDGFGPVSRDNRPEQLDTAFSPDTDIVFFGHHHPRADVQGIARYINPGALGTNPTEGARYALSEAHADGTMAVKLESVPYEYGPLITAMWDRNVPDARFILDTFLK